MAVKHLEPKLTITEISNAFLRLAKLYQIPNFDETNAMILAEWTIEKFKHKPLALILSALKDPPMLFEDGQVSKNWRLTPDTVYAWVDKKSREAEESRQLAQTRQYMDKLPESDDLSSEVKETIKNCLERLQADMFKPRKRYEMSPELKRIDLIMKLMNQYRKENFDPITGKPNANFMDEAVWLYDNGYELKDGQLKEI